MGNYRFRLSDMIPNAWFYKLRDMSKPRTTTNPNSYPLVNNKNPKKSSHSTPNILTSSDTRCRHDPPRKSSRKWPRRRTVYVPSARKVSPSITGGCSLFQGPGNAHEACFQAPGNIPTPSLHQGFSHPPLSGFQGPDSSNPLGSCKPTDIEGPSEPKSGPDPDFHIVSDPKLPPILTRPKTLISLETQPQSPTFKTPPENRTLSKKTRIRRTIRAKKTEARARKCTKEESTAKEVRFAIVKASIDPEKDFRESMMEMIVENNIKRESSRELEELLACYLSLNSNHYHQVIIKAFHQIWLSLSHQP